VLLRESPNKIVWTYLSHGTTALLFTEDGKHLSLPVPSGEAKTVQAALRTALPHATHGYSSRVQAQFQANPASLRA
jgi:hypothetical protein